MLGFDGGVVEEGSSNGWQGRTDSDAAYFCLPREIRDTSWESEGGAYRDRGNMASVYYLGPEEAINILLMVMEKGSEIKAFWDKFSKDLDNYYRFQLQGWISSILRDYTKQRLLCLFFQPHRLFITFKSSAIAIKAMLASVSPLYTSPLCPTHFLTLTPPSFILIHHFQSLDVPEYISDLLPS